MPDTAIAVPKLSSEVLGQLGEIGATRERSTWSLPLQSPYACPMPTSTQATVRTLDGLHLAGTLVEPGQPTSRAVVLVHGGGVTREEGGFFTRLADGLADVGV